MGTLFEQPPRAGRIPSDHLNATIEEVRRLEKSHGFTTEQAIRITEIAVQREWREWQKFDLDVKDEQLAGFGELLRELVTAIRGAT